MQSSEVAEVIIAMATERGPDKTICPSEVARTMFAHDWRKHMSEVRDTAIVLQQQGKVSITQKGAAVDVQNIKGPIRIKIV
jgi:fructose-specific phosphotransferase system component IIB